MIRLKLDPSGDTVTLSLTAYLGRDRFAAYRDVCYAVGARYVPAEKANRAPVGVVPQLIDELDNAGFAVEIDEQVAVKIKEQAADARALLDAGRDRLAVANARLAQKGLKLFRYQETGIEWLAPRDRALLCDEMGLGKTVQALLSIPEDVGTIVIVPAAVRYNWAAEVKKWRDDLDPLVIKSGSHFRWPEANEVLIATYGILPKTPEEQEKAAEKNPGFFGDVALPPPPIGTVLIADEAHLVKNFRANRTKRFVALKDQILDHNGRTWLLTGTPLLNRPPELWSLLKAANLAEESFGNWYNFVRLFKGSKGSYGGYDWGKPSEDVPDLLRKVSLHRKRTEVLKDLPAKQRRTQIVNGLDAATMALCDEVLDLLGEKGIDLTAVGENVEMTKLSGAAFEKMSAARAALATAKIPALMEIVGEYEEANEPVVVFSYHRAPIEALAKRDGWAVIMGDTPPDARGKIVERFQNGELKGIAGTISAMGVGVTLTHAHHLIMVDLAWTPALNNQAEDRVCRIGQTKGVFITRLQAQHALDERVIELITIKQEIIEASVGASAVDADHTAPSPAEELAATAEKMTDRITNMEKRKEEQERKIAADRKKIEEKVKNALPSGWWDGREMKISTTGKSRGPANDREAFAANALVTLAGLDPDRARDKNDVGFSAYDGEIGHSFANQIRKYGTLSEKQWKLAIKLAHKYRRQVGTLPNV